MSSYSELSIFDLETKISFCLNTYDSIHMCIFLISEITRLLEKLLHDIV